MCTPSESDEADCRRSDVTQSGVWKSFQEPQHFSKRLPTKLQKTLGKGRMVRQTTHIYEFGPFRLIPEERQLLRENQLVPVTPKPSTSCCARRKQRPPDRKSELMKRVWPDSFVEEANLSVKISALRRALGKDRMSLNRRNSATPWLSLCGRRERMLD